MTSRSVSRQPSLLFQSQSPNVRHLSKRLPFRFRLFLLLLLRCASRIEFKVSFFCRDARPCVFTIILIIHIQPSKDGRSNFRLFLHISIQDRIQFPFCRTAVRNWFDAFEVPDPTDCNPTPVRPFLRRSKPEFPVRFLRKFYLPFLQSHIASGRETWDIRGSCTQSHQV